MWVNNEPSTLLSLRSLEMTVLFTLRMRMLSLGMSLVIHPGQTFTQSPACCLGPRILPVFAEPEKSMMRREKFLPPVFLVWQGVFAVRIECCSVCSGPFHHAHCAGCCVWPTFLKAYQLSKAVFGLLFSLKLLYRHLQSLCQAQALRARVLREWGLDASLREPPLSEFVVQASFMVLVLYPGA